MPLLHIEQPEIIEIEPGLRLKKYDGDFEKMVEGYRDPVVYQNSEGIFEEENIPDAHYVRCMCRYLDSVGELYFIQVLQQGAYISVGDVTVKPENPPIAIWQAAYRRIGIGTKVMKTVMHRLSSLGYTEITGTSIFKWNIASQKLHENLGFTRVGETERDYLYACAL